MATEVSVSKPLSGIESMEAVLNALRVVMARDDRFSKHMAYNGFSAKVKVEFRPFQSYIPDVDIEFDASQGDTTGEAGEVATVTVDMPIQPPNAVREGADLPQPVLVKDGKGNVEEKWIRKGRSFPSGKIPSNLKVKGA